MLRLSEWVTMGVSPGHWRKCSIHRVMSSRRSSPKGGVEVHLQRGGFGGEAGGLGSVVRTRADVLPIVAAGFLFGGIQREVESLRIEDGRLGVGHGEDHGHTTGQRGRGRRVPVFFVSLAGFAHVDVRVDQSGKFEHVVYRYQDKG